MAVDQAKIRKAVRDILEAIGEDPDSELSASLNISIEIIYTSG